MRVNKGDTVVTKYTGMRSFGIVLEDADDRQGYFWMRFSIMMMRWSTNNPKRDDICVPFPAIDSVNSVTFGGRNVHLTLSRDEVEQLPQRWQVQPQPTVQEMVRGLPFGGGMAQPPMIVTGPFPMVPQLPASVPQQPAMPMPQPAVHPIVAVQEQVLASILEAKQRHAQRCRGASPAEQEIFDKLLTDELAAIKAQYDRQTGHLRMAEGI
jgi:hypothetical protein